MQRAREYLLALWSDWVGRMSGATSVVLAVINAIATIPSWMFWIASAFCFILASFRIWLSERKKVEALQEQVSKVGIIDRLVLPQKLLELAEYGTNHLQNKPVTTESEVYTLWYEYGKWEHELLLTMEQDQCKLSDISRVRVLGTFLPKGLAGANNHDAQVREWIAEQVLRVRDIAKQLEQKA